MNDYGYDTDFNGLGTGFGIGLLVVYVALVVFCVYLYCRVARKAGWSSWARILVLVPIVNIIVMLYFAFAEWPIARENKMLRAQLAAIHAQNLQQSGYGAPPSTFGSLPYGTPSAHPGPGTPPGATGPGGPATPVLPPRTW